MSDTIKTVVAATIMIVTMLALTVLYLQHEKTDPPCGAACQAHQYQVLLETNLEVERLFVNTLLQAQACALDVEEILADEAGGLVFTYTDEHRQDTYEILWVRSGTQDLSGAPLNICTDQPWPAVPRMP